MKFIWKTLVVLFALTTIGNAWRPYQQAKFKAWKQAYKKVYDTPESEQQAMDKLLKNDDEIEDHNQRFRSGKETFKRGLWKRSDLSFEEKQRLLTGSKQIPAASQLLQAAPAQSLKNPPSFLNLTAAGLVHAVDDQQTCGEWCFRCRGSQ